MLVQLGLHMCAEKCVLMRRVLLCWRERAHTAHLHRAGADGGEEWPGCVGAVRWRGGGCWKRILQRASATKESWERAAAQREVLRVTNIISERGGPVNGALAGAPPGSRGGSREGPCLQTADGGDALFPMGMCHSAPRPHARLQVFTMAAFTRLDPQLLHAHAASQLQALECIPLGYNGGRKMEFPSPIGAHL